MAQPNEQNGLVETFGNFHNGWLNRQQELLDRVLLVTSPNMSNPNGVDQDRKRLVEEVMAHYKHYYAVKAGAAREDVFLFFSPPWLSSLERTLLWLGEFKPSLVFRFINGAVRDLTEEQKERIEQVRAWTRGEERSLTDRMARVQERVAAAPLLGILRRVGKEGAGCWEESDMEEVTEELKAAMLDVMMTADELRGTTVAEVVEVLTSEQTLTFLAAAGTFQGEMRRRGLERDAQNSGDEVSGVNAADESELVK